MIYGDEKVRTMLRSILPSTARKHAYFAKRQIARGNRRAVNNNLTKIRSYEDAVEDNFDYDRPVDFGWSDMAEVVYERRNADKLAHFERWATVITDHIEDPIDRYNYIKALVPDNLIGRHALSHVEFIREFSVEYDHDRRFARRDYRTNAERAADNAAFREERIRVVANGIYNAIVAGYHTHINTIIKNSWVRTHKVHIGGNWKTPVYDYHVCPACATPRVCTGTSDIEAFVREWTNPSSKAGTYRTSDHGKGFDLLMHWLGVNEFLEPSQYDAYS